MSRRGAIFEALVDRYYEGIDPQTLADTAMADLEEAADNYRKERDWNE